MLAWRKYLHVWLRSKTCLSKLIGMRQKITTCEQQVNKILSAESEKMVGKEVKLRNQKETLATDTYLFKQHCNES